MRERLDVPVPRHNSLYRVCDIVGNAKIPIAILFRTRLHWRRKVRSRRADKPDHRQDHVSTPRHRPVPDEDIERFAAVPATRKALWARLLPSPRASWIVTRARSVGAKAVVFAAALFAWEDIPWAENAFPDAPSASVFLVRHVLEQHRRLRRGEQEDQRQDDPDLEKHPLTRRKIPPHDLVEQGQP